MNRRVSQCLEGRENNFDFIRFVASATVIFSHSYMLAVAGKELGLAITNDRYSLGGFAVMIFFIISGFLITRSYDRVPKLKEYFTARALRIFPALFAVSIVTALLIGPIVSVDNLKTYFSNSETLKYPLNGFALRIYEELPGVFAHNRFPNIVNGSLWTLPHEVMCYCLVATLGLLATKRFKLFIIVASVVALIVYADSYIFIKWKFFWDACWFLIGALYYIFRNKIVLNTKVAALMLVLMFININYNAIDKLYNVLTGIMLSYIVMTVAFIKTNHIKNFAKNGDYSYGLYIWGFLVQQLIAQFFTNLNHYYNFLLSFTISFCLAWLSWHLIEKRALKFKRKSNNQNDSLNITFVSTRQTAV